MLTKNNRFLTTKKDKTSHGIGLENIKEIVNKYNGNLDITHTETDFTITIFIGNL
ncbi:GHKL domain-containing protein [Aequitasia blattaphilus]|uniref:GHKL domain-containing protein n=1 Tax=Aequitasia blattaphilus TaxID=2949332 RepID=UPI003A7F3875